MAGQQDRAGIVVLFIQNWRYLEFFNLAFIKIKAFK
jgi:hypothetical protein